MSTIVLRSVKGSPLSNAEVDSNFTNLNNDKTQLGGTYSSGTANGVLFLSSSKVLTTGSALTFDGTNLGVGTSTFTYAAANRSVLGLNGSVSSLLEFQSGGTARAYAIASSAQFDVGTATAIPMAFTINGSEQMRLTNTGLGIGNSSPTAKLDVTGTAAISGAVTLSGGAANGVSYLNASKVLTTGSALTFDGASLVVGNAGTVLGSASLTLGSNFSIANAARQYLWSASNSFAWSMNAPGDAIAWYNNSGSEQMRLTSTGLGIGTSSPAEKLHVLTGTTYAANFSTTVATAATTRISIGTFTTSAGGAGGSVAIGSAHNHGATALSSMTFYTHDGSNAVERMRLDSSGNLGLGVTPSAWSVLRGFDVSTSGGFFGHSAQAGLSNNAFFNGTNWIYKNTAGAAFFRATVGSFEWHTAPSGTAGNAISFTQAMTLDASGNLLVGATSGSQKLFVVSTASAAAATAIKCANDGAGTFYLNTSGTADYSAAVFLTAGGATQVGSIVAGATTTTYNVTSDQRLKENIQDAASTSDLIDAIQVRQYDWKSDGSHQRYGFIAQELVTVAPEAVHQPADPEEMMAVDYSKLVPMLVKEIQSLRARVAALESI